MLINLNGYGPSIMRGAVLTMEVAFLSLAISLAMGMIGASAKLSSNPIPRTLATVYTTVIRGVPDFVLMMLIFFGGQVWINDLTDWINQRYDTSYFINVDPFVAGIIAIGFIYGAYMSETFRGAFLAVERGQIEAGKAYGFTRWHIFRRIMFPQMMRHALPGLGNNWQVLLKTTALVSIIGLEDMVARANEASRAVHSPFKFFIPVAAIYLALTAGSEIFIRWVDKRYSAGVVKE